MIKLNPNSSESLDLIILSYLRSLHSSTKFFIFKYLAYKKFFTNHKFQSISSIDENSPRIKTILDAAKIFSIKTAGIQHGTIHELHPAYMHTAKDMARKIVPDYTLVWGERWKELLAGKGHYSPESLIITGQIRTDIIPVLQKQTLKRYPDVPENSKIILFASQPQQDPKLRERSALDVFNAVKELREAFLIIKLHPAEFNDFDFYRKLAKKSGCSNYQIVLQEDLYFLISISDIIITCFSTVGAESVYFSKPLIILDHLKQDIQKYVKEAATRLAGSPAICSTPPVTPRA